MEEMKNAGSGKEKRPGKEEKKIRDTERKRKEEKMLGQPE